MTYYPWNIPYGHLNNTYITLLHQLDTNKPGRPTTMTVDMPLSNIDANGSRPSLGWVYLLFTLHYYVVYQYLSLPVMKQTPLQYTPIPQY